MKTILFTGYDAGYTPLAELTFPLMAEWADRRGYDWCAFTDPPTGLNIYWTGVARGLELLRGGLEPGGYDRVIYLDADQMITNMDEHFDGLIPTGFHASKDWGKDAKEQWHFSMCGFVAHKDCIPLFHRVLSMEPDYRDKPFQEQAPMQAAFQEILALKYYGSGSVAMPPITVHPRPIFNCVPDEVCPGNVPEPWQPGNFAAHLTMLPIDQRIALFHKIKATL